MTAPRRDTGFSLLELLVSMVIIGVLSTMGVVMFGKLIGYSTERQVRAELDRKAQNILDQIGQDIASIVSPDLTGQPLVGVPGSAMGNEKSDLLILPVAMPTPPKGRTIGRNVNIRVLGEDEQQGMADGSRPDDGLLLREIYAFDKEMPIGQIKIADGVRKFCVEYAPKGGGEWQSTWEDPQNRLPGAIRISVAVGDPKRPLRDPVSRKAVFPVNVE